MGLKLLQHLAIGVTGAMVGFACADDAKPPADSPPPAAAKLQAPYSKDKLDNLITEVAQGYGIDSALLHAIVTVESRYNPRALGPDGAAGLMQLMPGTAKLLGVTDVFDPEQNLRAGARHLRYLLDKFQNNLQLVIAAYHAGELAVIRAKNAVPPFPKNMEYVSLVLSHYHKYRAALAH